MVGLAYASAGSWTDRGGRREWVRHPTATKDIERSAGVVVDHALILYTML